MLRAFSSFSSFLQSRPFSAEKKKMRSRCSGPDQNRQWTEPGFQRNVGKAAADWAEAELSCRSPALNTTRPPPEPRSPEQRAAGGRSRSPPGRAAPNRTESDIHRPDENAQKSAGLTCFLLRVPNLISSSLPPQVRSPAPSSAHLEAQLGQCSGPKCHRQVGAGVKSNTWPVKVMSPSAAHKSLIWKSL